MQLDKLVNYHKALADPTRLRILYLLRDGPLHGQALAGKLGVTPATITHHMTQLRKTGIIREIRDKNTIYFDIDKYILKQNAEAVLSEFFEQKFNQETIKETALMETEKLEQTVLKNFITTNGMIKQLPAQRKRRLIVFEYLVHDLKPGQSYTEKEINAYIQRFHENFCTIRRELIVHQYMYRKDGIYELNPKAMWPNWRT